MLNDVQRSEGAFARLEAVLNEPIAVEDPPQPRQPKAVLGKVTFSAVEFAYAGDSPALSGIDVSIEPGTVCALVGPSGAGKSTFAKLIPRFYDVTGGNLLVDGVDVREWPQEALRSHIGIVPQMPFLFNDSIRNNLRLARPDASDEAIELAAKAAYAHDFIHALPQGYDTQVGENAVRLSGGQRQRLALARAFLHPAKILILDEATSALDSESEQMIQRALEQLVNGRTVFIIAHRFSTIQQAQRILLFDQGKIVADGSQSQLANHPLFRKLYENQILK
ncbi:MAG: ABC transporter ATP-binding protein/permease [Verrucomicrobia bacterium]|nr:ABC transporter ATP-binding protein/permease [Verrucomicrobiota bacterium]